MAERAGISASPKEYRGGWTVQDFPFQCNAALEYLKQENGQSSLAVLRYGRTWLKSLLCQAEQGFRPASNSPRPTYTNSVYLSPLLQKYSGLKKKKKEVRNAEVAANGCPTPASCPERSHKHTCTCAHQLRCQ